MADRTHIEWTDATWNPITGCSVVSPGCTNCYAMKLAGGRMQHHPSRAGLTSPSNAGPVWNGEVRFNEAWLQQPFAWTRPRRIFVCAHGDLFHEKVPDAWIDLVFAVMASNPRHTFQVLTKRAERMRDYLHPRQPIQVAMAMGALIGADVIDIDVPRVLKSYLPLPNVWLGVSAEDQPRADDRVQILKDTPAAVRFVSAEPLIGGIRHDWTGIDQVIVGGEGGPRARPMHPDWPREILADCTRDGAAFFFKQWGEWAPHTPIGVTNAIGVEIGGATLWRVGKRLAGRKLDGRIHDAMPIMREVLA